MPNFLRKAIGLVLLFATVGLANCQAFVEAAPQSRTAPLASLPLGASATLPPPLASRLQVHVGVQQT